MATGVKAVATKTVFFLKGSRVELIIAGLYRLIICSVYAREGDCLPVISFFASNHKLLPIINHSNYKRKHFGNIKAQLDYKINYLQMSEGNLELEIAECNPKNENLELRNDDLEREIKDLELQNARLKSKNIHLKSENRNLEPNIDELKHKINDLETKINHLKSKNGELETKFNRLESKIGDLKTKIDHLKHQNRDLELKNSRFYNKNGGIIIEKMNLRLKNGGFSNKVSIYGNKKIIFNLKTNNLYSNSLTPLKKQSFLNDLRTFMELITDLESANNHSKYKTFIVPGKYMKIHRGLNEAIKSS